MAGERLRLAELLGPLSVALDLGMGQPEGHAIRTCGIALRLAEALGLSVGECSDVFYVALLRYLGCSADAAELAALAGDEIALGTAVAPFVMGPPDDHEAAAPVPDPATAMAASMRAHCEAAELLAARLPVGPEVCRSLRHAFERWDGSGHPYGLAGTAIPQAVRIAVVARDVEVWQRRTDHRGVRTMLRSRRGRAYDPEVVDAWLHEPDAPGIVDWEQLWAAEPAARTIGGDELDEVFAVFADFADIKLPYALGHSRQVSRLAADAMSDLGADPQVVVDVRHAGLLHDLGRVGISNQVWDSPGPLSADQWERIRLHPYLTERILHRTPTCAPIAALAGSHHERLDGSGYHRQSDARDQTLPMRVLAAADTYSTKRQARPHRPALNPRQTGAALADEARRGTLDGRAVSAVLTAAAETTARTRWHAPGDLTEREVEVLGHIARGLTIRQVAFRLGISVKTVDRHVQNTYAKIGVGTRAGAAVFAAQHGLLG